MNLHLHRALLGLSIAVGIAALGIGVLASFSLPAPNDYRLLGVLVVVAATVAVILAALISYGHLLILTGRRAGGYMVAVFSALSLAVILIGTARREWPLTLIGPNLVAAFLAINLWSGLRAIQRPR